MVSVIEEVRLGPKAEANYYASQVSVAGLLFLCSWSQRVSALEREGLSLVERVFSK